MKSFLLIFCFVFIAALPAVSQDSLQTPGSRLSVGLVFSKVHNGQWENGFNLKYTHTKLWAEKISVNFRWISNEFGTGLGSNNIFTKHTFLWLPRLQFRPHKLMDPFLGFQVGYTQVFFDERDSVESLFSKQYEQEHLVYGANFGIRWNLHKIYGGPLTGIQYDLKHGAGLSFPLTSTIAWSFPLFPRKL